MRKGGWMGGGECEKSPKIYTVRTLRDYVAQKNPETAAKSVNYKVSTMKNL